MVVLNHISQFAQLEIVQFLFWQGNLVQIVGTQRIHKVAPQKKTHVD